MCPYREDQSALGMQLKRIEEDCKTMSLDLSSRIITLRDDLLNSIDAQPASAQLSLLPAISQQLQEIQSLVVTIPIQHRILRQLIFDDMESRQNQILDADASTCSWILGNGYNQTISASASISDDSTKHRNEEEIYRQHTQRDFITWLRSSGHVFHISGNAGSGKSTLMKFIGMHARTRNELEVWAGSKRLVFGQFYFWNSGNQAQRTISGLHRTLLFQTLSQCPELIEDVFPLQLSQMKTSQFQSDVSVEKIQVFDDAKIQDAFDLLLNKIQHAHHKFCFFIDGLDEYEGNRLAHEDLATKLKGWTSGGDVKLLVTSRPWPEFHDIFKGNPTIHLHKLNSFDIQRYCFQQLEQDREINTIGVDRMRVLIQEFVREITRDSQGIFLWAHLVLQAIRQGIRQGDSTTRLKEKLKEFPSDLDDLYTKLREPIEKSNSDRIRSNQMLLLAAHAPDEFRLLAVAVSWLADDKEPGLFDPDFPSATECRPYSAQEITMRLDRVTRQVYGLTRGLLEIVTESESDIYWSSDRCLDDTFALSRVRFCHRTARDYVMEKRYADLRDSWPDFDETDIYGRIHLAKFVYGLKPGVAAGLVGSYLNKEYCEDFSVNTIRKFEAPLGPLLRPLWVSSTPYVDKENRYYMNNDHSRVTFLQYATYCKLDRFVHAAIAADPSKGFHSQGTNILISSIRRNPNWQFSLSLLQTGVVDLDFMIETEIEQEGTLMLPTWVVGLWVIVTHYIYPFRHLSYQNNLDEPELCVVQLLRHLHEHGVRVGQSLAITVGMYRGRVSEREIDISSEQAVQWVECVFARDTGQYVDGLESDGVLQTMAELYEWDQENRSSRRGVEFHLVALKWQSQHVVVREGNAGFGALYRKYRVY